MITRIEALNYRCLRYVRQDLGPFHVLVGPNASGKTTFLDVVAFLGKLVSDGPEAAVEERTQNFEDLVWGRRGDRFELAIETAIPEVRQPTLGERRYTTIRYEVRIGLNSVTEEVSILAEKVVLKVGSAPTNGRALKESFPDPERPPASILTRKSQRHSLDKIVIEKDPAGKDHYYSEWAPGPNRGLAFSLGPRKSALANLPADETRYPVTIWLKDLMSANIQRVVLNNRMLQKASPPQRGHGGFKPDGSNLPWLIESLRHRSPDKYPRATGSTTLTTAPRLSRQSSTNHFRDWIDHLRTALPDVEDIRTVERADDRHRYLVVRYQGGIEVPSWMVSDGTLRLLALTLPAYLQDFRGTHLIEEPENGIHPRAVETMFQSLSSVYDAQILLATHSPVILSIADPKTVLCFAKSGDGATDIVLGGEHPSLREWRGETNLGVLFAAGVLG